MDECKVTIPVTVCVVQVLPVLQANAQKNDDCQHETSGFGGYFRSHYRQDRPDCMDSRKERRSVMNLLEIAVAAPLEETLTYSLPADLTEPDDDLRLRPLIGRRVLVPLQGRKVTGYILSEQAPGANAFKIRNVLEVLDAQPLFPPTVIPLFRWIAQYYHYPIGEVIKSALPGGLSPKSVKYLHLTATGRQLLAKRQVGLPDNLLTALLDSGRLSVTATRTVLASEQYKKIVQQLVAAGELELHQSITGDSVGEKLETCYRLGVPLPEPEHPVAVGHDVFSSYRRQLRDHAGLALKLSEAKTLYYLESLKTRTSDGRIPRKELVTLYSGATQALRALQEQGIVQEEKSRVYRSPLGEQLEYFPAPQTLTKEQQGVLGEILPAVDSGGYAPFLLHGVTGSGKTEVYLQAAAATLARGRSVLVIVPEIALATQLEAHFVSRFSDQVVLLHSGLTPTEKFDQWSLALSGQARIVIGARSAIFAPLQDPGLIVVDEEHDGGLKQDEKLRYNGRDLAVVRARQQQAVVLLSSATPSVVSYHNAITGKYRLLTMEKRVGDRPLPKVTLIDLRQALPGRKRSLFRPPLEQALTTNLERGRQSVILINRRGFSANVICQECGAPVQCRDCHVSLTLHRSSQQLLCHYCGYSVHEKTVCASCGSISMTPIGFGTERVEEELRTLLPQARIARLDADSARDRTEFLHTLKKMRSGEIDVLVGTQMVAKGHHFPGVTLVGVVWADGGLSIPDYRAAEKTFQLITQVTGRAGRGENSGEVFIQTMRPEHYAIAYARNHSYRGLVEKELELRKNPRFPPYVRLVALHIQGASEQDVQRSAARIAAACRAAVDQKTKSVEILGPAPSPLDRLKKMYRWQVMIKSVSTGDLDAVCRYVLTHQQELVIGRCRVLLDKDPENMM